MSTFDTDPKDELRKARVAKEQREQANKEVQNEVDYFVSRTLKSIGEPSTEMRLFSHALIHENILIMRGMKARIEQQGAMITKMSALAHQAWDATQVTIDVHSKQSLRAHKAAQKLKDKLATHDGPLMVKAAMRHIASSINPDEFGFRDPKDVNDTFKKSQAQLLAMAQHEAARGNVVTGESQAAEALNRLMKENAGDLQNLPGVQDAMKLRVEKDPERG